MRVSVANVQPVPAVAKQGPVKVLIHEPCRPYARGPSEPDFKRIVCQHSRTVQTAQSLGLNLRSKYSVYFSKRMNCIRQPMSTRRLDWTEWNAGGHSKEW